MAQTTQASVPRRPTAVKQSTISNIKNIVISENDPSIPPTDILDSPFLTAFLTATPVATEIISHLSTPQKQYLFATCHALSEYRDSCYAWRNVTLTKSGYEPRTSLAMVNYQIQARIAAQGRYIYIPDEKAKRERAEREGWHVEESVEKYFCRGLESSRIWDMFSLRPAFGRVLKELVLDGTGVDIEFVKKVLAICAVGGKGLKSLSLRYCEKTSLGDIADLIPKEYILLPPDESEDSGFESQSEDEEESLLKGLAELRIYGIKDLHLGSQDHKHWLVKLDRFFKYTTNKKIRTDVGWCSQTLQGPKKKLRRPHCHAGRDLPFIRILPLADTGSTRKTACMECKKTPEQVGWYCDGCLKDVLSSYAITAIRSVPASSSAAIALPAAAMLASCRTVGRSARANHVTANQPVALTKLKYHALLALKGKRSRARLAIRRGSAESAIRGYTLIVRSRSALSNAAAIMNFAMSVARVCTPLEYTKGKPPQIPFLEYGMVKLRCFLTAAKSSFLNADIPEGTIEELIYVVDSAEYPIIPKGYDAKAHDESYFKDNIMSAILNKLGLNKSGAETNVEHLSPAADSKSENYETSSIESAEKQAGVQKVEAIALTWTKTSLWVAYAGILLMATSTSLEAQTTYLYSSYALSGFGFHSLLSTVSIVTGVMYAVVKPPMAKIADVFGRFEAFAISILFFCIGYIMLASSSSVEVYAGAQVFYAAGSTGLLILQQIFMADTTDLLNRALFSSLPDLPFLWTVWAGPKLGATVLQNTTWRWGYGMWAIILPVCALPLLGSLFYNTLKAKKKGLLPPSRAKELGWGKFLVKTFWDLDIIGLLLFTAALCLILIPLTLGAGATGKWKNASLIAMLVVGGVCLIAFPFFEMSKKLAPSPLLHLRLLKNRTVMAGCLIAVFYFMAFYQSVFPYFYSYLVVANEQSVVSAGRIVLVFSFTSTVSSIIISFIIKYTGHYKYFVIAGGLIYILGFGLMLRYRVEGSTRTQIVINQVLVGLGGGFLNVPAQLGVQSVVPHQDVGLATALFLTSISVGQAIGSAISGAIWTNNLLPKLNQYLPEEVKVNATLIYSDFTHASSYPPGSPARLAINKSYQETMRLMLIGALVSAVPIIFLTLLMENVDLKKQEQNIKGRVFGSSGSDADKRVAEEEAAYIRRQSHVGVVA
ncbi:hypothetical protein H072_8072 [Dactylellina haptotyla CBS 200.50]|uniref:Major facilitator superfamily (MFS) profile domain-containing protein n=1 Tax=Dactylellina haptotyla (strain CBS 200.50) TaxID=1284197 RepID=S8A5S9_DACHA|nr:hypothetical protein H072_8072 [Dactylellina haptotyla CBS 200.50]